ncbi:tetratricopeptide repeat protein [Xanthobacter agilis]|uniref:TPR repeat protein n=1 Tax=Xanthobacter agilis TaxID=47492 RepID=A0ABU0L852_XANAG|nr:tetratricopeptide repeat protein [Xanthobacter agilis]MDQ0503321.1 TPR repeat protein [Xanthobacter agilis]
MALYAKGDYMAAARLLTRLAEAGDARAQAMLGLLYEYGHGVPQDFAVAAWWYGCAAERGDANGQYLLGRLYDKGRGVPQDVVLAQKWLILAAARSGRPERETYVRIRDAVASKMSRAQITLAQQLALQWVPSAPTAGP